MRTVTATELARNFKEMFDLVEFHGEEQTVVRNNHPVARIVPGPAIFTVRDNAIRIISVRRSRKKEADLYEEKGICKKQRRV